MYQCENLNEAVQIFSSSLSNILDCMAPVKKIQIRNRFAPWLSEATKQLMKERDFAQITASETKKAEDQKDYKNLETKLQIDYD